MILDQTSGAIQQLATTAGLNVWTWSGVSAVSVTKLFKLKAAQTYVDGIANAQTYVDGIAAAESYVDGAVQTQTSC